jgi:hypothetical protein
MTTVFWSKLPHSRLKLPKPLQRSILLTLSTSQELISMSLQIGSQLGNLNASSPKARAKCAQCGRELLYVPFPLNNITCRDCYGQDRYHKGGRGPSKTVAKVAAKAAANSGITVKDAAAN